MNPLPLQGFRVVDASSVVMGPYASQWLADLGAEVIKVESPEGDSTRYTGPATEHGMSALFLGVNRNKKSVVIDLKKPDGPVVMRQLIASADVFMHSMRPQKLAAVGLDPKDLLAAFPRLVFAGLHGFTASGPYGGKPAYDDIIQGLSGNADLMAQQSGVPRYFPSIAADKTSGLVAAMAIMAGLMKRHTTGLGGMVEVPMFETMVSFNLVENLYGEHFDPPLSDPGYPRVLSQWRRPYRTRDGHVCMMPYTDAHWQKFFLAVDQPTWAADARFANMSARTQHIEALYELTGHIVAQQETAHWLRLCEQLEIPAAPMNTLADLKSDPHLQATQFFAQLDDPAMGALRFPGVPVLFDGHRPPVTSVPRLGEHTQEVFAHIGITSDTVSEWLDNGTVCAAKVPPP